MRVLLCNSSRELFVTPAPPLALAILGAVLNQRGHEVRCLDLTLWMQYEEEVKRVLRDFQPDVIGISIRNLDAISYPSAISFVPAVLSVVRNIALLSGNDERGRGGLPIVLGGAAVTICTEQILRSLGEGYLAVRGEGEEVLVDIVEALEEGKDPRLLPQGVAFLDSEGSYVERAPKLIQDLDRVPTPARNYLDNHSYVNPWDERIIANVQTKRGCPLNCIFCTYPSIEGHGLRLRSTARVVDELMEIRYSFGIKSVFFVDNVFNIHHEQAMDLCQAIIRRKPGLQWAANLAANERSLELLPLMAEAGCVHVALAADSFSDQMLDSMQKGASSSLIERVANRCTELGLEVFLSIIFGAPGETPRTVQATLEVLKRIWIRNRWEGHRAKLIHLGMRIYPRTRLEQIAIEEGVLQPGTNLLMPHHYISPTIGADRLIEIIHRELGEEQQEFSVPGIGMVDQGMFDLVTENAQLYGNHACLGIEEEISRQPVPVIVPVPVEN
ncbi:MAG: radical SAM protein [bacterium]